MPRQRSLLFESVVLGVVGAFSALLFSRLVDLGQWLMVDRLHGDLTWLPLVTAGGGLLTGLLIYLFCPEAEGHGTDAAIGAWHRRAGALRARVPLVKTLASALTIGSGGSAGREGPTALIAGGVGSLFATWRGRSDADRRMLLLVGAAAGLAAIFRSPVGAAFFMVEVLYSRMELEASALLYCMLASIVAYALTGQLTGWEPLFRVPEGLTVHTLAGFGLFALLGLVAGVVAAAFPAVFYGLRDLFRRLPLPAWLKPALGGLLLGLLVQQANLPQLLGGGYATMQDAIDDRLGLGLLLALMVLKMVALALTISSGGSGGVFAPALYVGAMLGGVFAHLSGHHAAPYVVVGMAAVFSGAARVPVATLLMVTEMTQGYQLLVPAALAVFLAYLVQARLTAGRRYPSLYEEQVATRAESPAHAEENLRLALDLLSRGGKALPAEVDVAALLDSGVDLPEGRRMRLHPVDGPGVRLEDLGGEALCVLRDGSPVPHRPGEALEPGDRVLLSVSA